MKKKFFIEGIVDYFIDDIENTDKFIRYDSKMLDNYGDQITVYYDKEKNIYTDDGWTFDDLCSRLSTTKTKAEIRKIITQIAKDNYCDFEKDCIVCKPNQFESAMASVVQVIVILNTLVKYKWRAETKK